MFSPLCHLRASISYVYWLLRDVVISVRVGGVSFHVVTIDETFNPLLQVCWFDGEFELLVQLGDEKVVSQRLAHLHYAHDGSIDLVLPILIKKGALTVIPGCLYSDRFGKDFLIESF